MFDVRKIQEQAIYSAIKEAGGEGMAKEIVYGEHGQYSLEDNATWVKSTMSRLESRFGKPLLRQIRRNCQCGYGMDEKLALVQELVASSSCLEEFASQDKARAAGLYCERGELYLQFAFCACPMLAGVGKMDTDTWCLCTTGYSKTLFEKAFGCAVEVELLQSIKMGCDTCIQKIIPLGSVWK